MGKIKKIWNKIKVSVITFFVTLVSSVLIYFIVKNNKNTIIKREEKIEKIDKKVEKWLKKYGDI